MSWTKIDTAYDVLRRFIPEDNEELRQTLEDTVQEIRTIQQDNIQAWIPVLPISEKSVDISEYTWMTDYEILTGYHTAPDGTKWRSAYEYRSHLESKSIDVYTMETHYVVFDPKYPHITFGWDGESVVENFTCSNVEDAEKAIEYLREYGEDEEAQWIFRSHYVVFKHDPDDGSLKEMEFESSEESEAEAEMDDLRVSWVDDQMDELGEFEYDEIMMNTAYRLGQSRSVNHDLAQDLGMAVIRFISGEHEGEEFMVTTGAGSDMTPAYVCYKAIEFGYVEECDMKWFEGSHRNYFIDVVGRNLFNAALRSLNQDRFIDG